MLGEEPVDGGDTFYVYTTNGMVKWLSYEEPLETMPQNVSTEPSEEADDSVDNEDDTTEGNTPNPSESSEDDSQKGNKKGYYTGYHDTRESGKMWSPSVNRVTRMSLQNETDVTQKSKKPIPDHLRGSRKSPELPHAEMVLSNAVSKIFSDASKRGYRELLKAGSE
jgi:hypothetical protein